MHQLGYGTRNAFLYHKRDKILRSKRIEKIPLKLHIWNSSSFNLSLEKELDYLWSHLKPCGEYAYSPLIIGSVHFVGDLSNSETVSLIAKYKKMRGYLSALYADGYFLHRTLSQIISE